MLVNNLESIKSQSGKEQRNILFKKIAIVKHHNVAEYISTTFVDEMIESYENIERYELKAEIFAGLFAVHKEWLASLID